MTLLVAIFLCCVSAYLIWCSTDSFEPAADYLGRNLPLGVKGATLNAIGSSLPELLTASALLFLFHDQDGFAAGVGACAGSAVFNLTIIPTACIIVVALQRRAQDPADDTTEQRIRIHPKVLLRDGLFFLLAEFVLILCLAKQEVGVKTGCLLVAIYGVYAVWIVVSVRKAARVAQAETSAQPLQPPDVPFSVKRWPSTGLHEFTVEQQQLLDDISEVAPLPKQEGGAQTPQKSTAKALLQLDFNALFFQSRSYLDGDEGSRRARTVLCCSLAIMGGACYGLAESVVMAADALSIPTFITAFILAAAATSMPDTILSVRDAKKGNYDDAFANAFGSNTFDISVCIGLPLLIYSLCYGDIEIAQQDFTIGALRVCLLVASIAVLLSCLATSIAGSALSRFHGAFFMVVYVWFMYTVLREAYAPEHDSWIHTLADQMNALAQWLRI